MATHEDLAWIQNPKFELNDQVKTDFSETTGDIFQSTLRNGEDHPWDDIHTLWLLSEAYNSGPVFEKRESMDQAPWDIKPHYWCPVTKSLHGTGHHRSDIRIVEFFPHGFAIDEAEMIFGRDLDLGEISKPDCYAETVLWSLDEKRKWEDLSHEERMASEAFWGC
ncbi:hypothetical protein HII31_04008 [Pseudocercospora fuligena]|uniref:Uncharacterized protein n=1 Tax=Pseudocercospora fuligena TaxID=685502 RepID=A0A8H6RLT2_9PEZI|nr:hypothetical protein HII31_04008 [Pseudocercospora fuligena]